MPLDNSEGTAHTPRMSDPLPIRLDFANAGRVNAVDGEDGGFEAIALWYNRLNMGHDDIVTPGALEEPVNVPLYRGHFYGGPRLANVDLTPTKENIEGVGTFFEYQWGRDARMEMLEAARFGLSNDVSIGFWAHDLRWADEDELTDEELELGAFLAIDRIDPIELSMAYQGANPGAEITRINSAGGAFRREYSERRERWNGRRKRTMTFTNEGDSIISVLGQMDSFLEGIEEKAIAGHVRFDPAALRGLQGGEKIPAGKLPDAASLNALTDAIDRMAAPQGDKGASAPSAIDEVRREVYAARAKRLAARR